MPMYNNPRRLPGINLTFCEQSTVLKPVGGFTFRRSKVDSPVSQNEHKACRYIPMKKTWPCNLLSRLVTSSTDGNQTFWAKLKYEDTRDHESD
jgi:hypothetical protein